MTTPAEQDESWFRCEKCGKKLVKRLANGLWHFKFGRKVFANNSVAQRCPVEIFIHGSIRMRCLNGTCNYLNTLNYFPNKPVHESASISAESFETTSEPRIPQRDFTD